MRLNHATRLILAPGRSIIYNEALLHAVSKSRDYIDENTTIHRREDMRLSMYFWLLTQNNSRNCTVRTTDGIARQYGGKVYCETIHKYTCPQLYEDDPSRTECCKPENVIDLRKIPVLSGQTGEIIVGDLRTLGWFVAIGVQMTDSQRKGIKAMLIQVPNVQVIHGILLKINTGITK